MPDYLTYKEQESYDKVISLINKYVFHNGFRDEIIEALDELVENLANIDLD